MITDSILIYCVIQFCFIFCLMVLQKACLTLLWYAIASDDFATWDFVFNIIPDGIQWFCKGHFVFIMILNSVLTFCLILFSISLDFTLYNNKIFQRLFLCMISNNFGKSIVTTRLYIYYSKLKLLKNVNNYCLL